MVGLSKKIVFFENTRGCWCSHTSGNNRIIERLKRQNSKSRKLTNSVGFVRIYRCISIWKLGIKDQRNVLMTALNGCYS